MQCNLCEGRAVEIYATFKDYQLLKCKDCGLLVTDQHSVRQKDLYASDYFQGVHGNFFADCKVGYETRLDKSEKLQNFAHVLRKLKEMKPEGKLLDIGCATGVFLDMAQKQGFSVQGVDVSQYACTYARENFGVPTSCGYLEEIGLEEKQFDVITMWDLVEHVPDPKAFLKEARKLLKNDGVLFILTINDSSLMGWLAEGMYLGSFKTFPTFTRMIHPVHHNYHFKESHLRRYLKESGYQVVWKEKSEMPIETIEGGPLVKGLAHTLYFFSKGLHLEREIRLIVKKA
jgi:2-polyprenyl-3-methyl-5-hydroxy-6-metoxy-1,4-benzoquinol methylase